MLFRGVSPDDRVAVRLDNLTILYHRPSGETHVLAQPLPEILAALDGGETDLPGLLARLGVDATEDARQALAARLTELVASGLIERT